MTIVFLYALLKRFKKIGGRVHKYSSIKRRKKLWKLLTFAHAKFSYIIKSTEASVTHRHRPSVRRLTSS
jgi:hypothetical protein